MTQGTRKQLGGRFEKGSWPEWWVIPASCLPESRPQQTHDLCSGVVDGRPCTGKTRAVLESELFVTSSAQRGYAPGQRHFMLLNCAQCWAGNSFSDNSWELVQQSLGFFFFFLQRLKFVLQIKVMPLGKITLRRLWQMQVSPSINPLLCQGTVCYGNTVRNGKPEVKKKNKKKAQKKNQN